ncbi:TonB-dependent siderophore receptor [Phenylobacterium sp.]|jgi:iron complex outermembrane receptor protein|uniref:TonB-dependent siderophore receptor n=1 Tax=Phenylobacterium sp. TaxID=1871053 RepID=UPI002F91DF46
MPSLPRRLPALLLAGVSLLATAAAAAESDAEAPRDLDELVVTADRGFAAQAVQAGSFRNARVIDTPLTVSVISREVIEAQAARGLYDALRNTGGVTRSQLSGSTYDNIAIRGILVENRGNYRLNGALPVINLVEQPLENKARVEVLKGASALYYGFVPPSGVINMTTERPLDEAFNELTLRADSHGGYTGDLDVSRRFADGRIGARANLAYGEVETGVDRVQGERALATLALDVKPSDRLSVRLDYEYIEKDITEPPAIALLPAVGGVVRLPEVPDSSLNLGDKWLRYDAFAQNVMVRADYRISSRWAAKLEVGEAVTERDRFFTQFQNYNLATGDGQLQVSITRDQRFTNRNARAEIAGLVDTGPITHEITVGWTANERRSRGFSGPNQLTPQNLFNPRRLPVLTFPTRTVLARSNITDEGLYVFDRMEWGPLQVLGGLRRSDYQSVTTPPTGAITVYEVKETTPLGALIYKPVDWVSLYATYLEGMEEGGVAPPAAVNAFEVLPPAKSDQWEVGAKAEFGRSLVASIAYFQITRPNAFTNPERRYVLDGEVDYRGVEAMASGELTENLSLIASALWLDAEQTRGSAAVVGRRPENTAEWTASLFAEWRTPWVEGLHLSAGLFYTGDRAANPQNQAFIDGYVLAEVGARLKREIAGRETTFQVNVENLADKQYWNTAGNGFVGVGAPRTVKVRVTRAF